MGNRGGPTTSRMVPVAVAALIRRPGPEQRPPSSNPRPGGITRFHRKPRLKHRSWPPRVEHHDADKLLEKKAALDSAQCRSDVCTARRHAASIRKMDAFAATAGSDIIAEVSSAMNTGLTHSSGGSAEPSATDIPDARSEQGVATRRSSQVAVRVAWGY